tara:strand:+ start:240 stop:455 length:216 start_codon:yes stop_codon:yes gene_type:complete
MYEEILEAPSFLPPKIRISDCEIGQAPNQYFMSASRLLLQTLISSQKAGYSLLTVSSLSISVTDGSYPPKT